MLAALGFLTTVGGARRPTPGALAWFPVVGLALGLVLGGVWWAADEIWPPVLAAVIVVAVDLALTGLLHVDGLADSADGLLAHEMAPERRLEVMATPDVGAYGATVVALTVVARVGALAALAPEPLLLAGLWMASRTVMAVVPALVPYAREDGLATAFLAERPARWPALGLVVAVGLGVAATGGGGGVAVVAVLVGAAAVLALARRRVGGFTGDVLGASAVVGETVGLVVAGAAW